MSDSSRSFMFKSKSGNHLNSSSFRKQNEQKRIRTTQRFDRFDMNRIIEQTPNVVRHSPTTTRDEGIGLSSNELNTTFELHQVDEASNVAAAAASPVNAKTDRPTAQKAFRDRFGQYLAEKRLKQQQKPKVKPPFISSVPSGRLTDSKNESAKMKKKAPTEKIERAQQCGEPSTSAGGAVVDKAMSICNTPCRRSPIATRSKKLPLAPMLTMQQLTPKRKSSRRKSINLKKIQPTLAMGVNRRRSITKTGPVTKEKLATALSSLASRTTIGAIKKTLQTNQPTKIVKKPLKAVTATTTATATARIIKPIVPNAKMVNVKAAPKINPVVRAAPVNKAFPSKTSASKPNNLIAKKPVSALQVKKTPKVPKTFNFGPSTFKSQFTSTVMKTKKPVAPRSSDNLFNESFSPIESPPEQKNAPSTLAPKIDPVGAASNNFIDFASPLVKITRKIPQKKIEKTPINQNGIVKEKLKETPSQIQNDMNKSINYVSPFVTIARGRARLSSQKEKEARDSKYQLSSRKSLDFEEPIADRQKKEAAIYFRLQVQTEVDKFEELIKKWSKYVEENKESDSIPAECVDQIDTAIGQTRLLMRSKFKQFDGLIDKFELGKEEGGKPIDATDLEGFWSMLFVQVDNCNGRFIKLDELKANDWKEPVQEVAKIKKIRAGGVSKSKTAPAKRAVNSQLAEMLKAARKKHMETKNGENNQIDLDDVMVLTKRRSIAVNGPLQPSNIQRVSTPNKALNKTPNKRISSPWIVTSIEDPMPVPTLTTVMKTPNKNHLTIFGAAANNPTPGRGILKTPGSVQKKRLTLTFKSSPEVKLYKKDSNADD